MLSQGCGFSSLGGWGLRDRPGDRLSLVHFPDSVCVSSSLQEHVETRDEVLISSSIILQILNYFVLTLCVWMFCLLCLFSCMIACGGEKTESHPLELEIDDCELPSRCWTWTPLKELSVLSTAKPSLYFPRRTFWDSIFLWTWSSPLQDSNPPLPLHLLVSALSEITGIHCYTRFYGVLGH